MSALREVGCGALAVGLPLLVYLRTMAPTVYGLDSAELTTGAYALGIVHAPGSPTYMLLGHVFAQLPLGDVGYRLNLMSAVAAALAVLFLYLVLRRLTG
ncbi:MAG: protein O-mannosyl-transferase family, partial [Myxococcota bacterium]